MAVIAEKSKQKTNGLTVGLYQKDVEENVVVQIVIISSDGWNYLELKKNTKNAGRKKYGIEFNKNILVGHH